MTDAETVDSTRRAPRGIFWLWHPPLPLKGVPVFIWPPQPLEALRFLLSRGFLWGMLVPFGALAVVSWVYLQPALERCAEFRLDWISQVYLRNLGLMVLVAGGLHLYLYTFKRQGSDGKMNPREPTASGRTFFAGNQVWDNMFWSCASGVTLWTAYEVGFLWAYANGLLPVYLDWTQHPVWFGLTFLAIPFWSSVHFYFVHRLLHWKPLYKLAHAVHHRNESTGPWSGFSMHPIEHLVFLSSVLIHLVVASHPIHILFHNQFNALQSATGHAGFDSLRVKGKPVMWLTPFHHQLHHRHFNCNYGNELMPCDRWFGTDYDGTHQSWAALVKRRLARRAGSRRS